MTKTATITTTVMPTQVVIHVWITPLSYEKGISQDEGRNYLLAQPST
jgi:hypothetical protein